VILIGGLAIWGIVGNRQRAAETEERTQELEDYTGSLRAFIQTVTGPAGEMATARTLPPDELASEAKGWRDQLTSATQQVVTLPAPEGLRPINALIEQSMTLYSQAARGFELSAEAEGDLAKRLARQATETWASANTVFEESLSILNLERGEVELAQSGLSAPGTSAPPTGPETGEEIPGTEITVPPGGGNGGGGGENERGDDKGGGKDDGGGDDG
jgi:hypothetical protein